MSYTSSLPALVLSTCIEHWQVLSVWYLLVDDTECSFVKIQQCIFFFFLLIFVVKIAKFVSMLLLHFNQSQCKFVWYDWKHKTHGPNARCTCLCHGGGYTSSAEYTQTRNLMCLVN